MRPKGSLDERTMKTKITSSCSITFIITPLSIFLTCEHKALFLVSFGVMKTGDLLGGDRKDGKIDSIELVETTPRTGLKFN